LIPSDYFVITAWVSYIVTIGLDIPLYNEGYYGPDVTLSMEHYHESRESIIRALKVLSLSISGKFDLSANNV